MGIRICHTIFLFVFIYSVLPAQVNNDVIIRPDTGEVINNQNYYKIKWTGHYPPVIYFSDNGGKKWSYTRPSTYDQGDTNTAYWRPPYVVSADCRIKLYFEEYSTYCISGKFTLYGSDSDTISINNLTMWQINNGLGSYNHISSGSGLTWSNKHVRVPILSFTDGPVWGGKVNDQIRSNGVMYRSGLSPGNKLIQDTITISPGSNSTEYRSFKLWKLRKDITGIEDSSLIDEYKFNYDNWPGELGAPYTEVFKNGKYDQGIDLPRVIGDEEMFFINNDYDTTQSRWCFGSDPIGIEIQTLIFAYKRNNPVDDVIFKKYLLINTGSQLVEDMYFGFFVDIDLGNSTDDLNGCDSTLGMGFTYNGIPNDDFWGTPPPATGYILIQGPKIPAPADSAMFNGRYLKGYKNIPLTSFTNYINGSSLYQYPALGKYDGSVEVYNNMKGLFYNGDPVIDPTTGKVVKFSLAGNPVTKTGWFDGEGWPDGPGPGQRYWSMGCGPYNFAPGDTQEVVIAIIAAMGTDNLNSVEELKNKARFVKQFYQDEVMPEFQQTYDIPNEYYLYQNYPNPFNAGTELRFSIPADNHVRIIVYNILGQKVITLIDEIKTAGVYEIPFSGSALASGIYFYRIEARSLNGQREFIQTKKMVYLK